MIGTWSLDSYATIDSEVPFEGDEPKANALEEWLYTKGREGFADLKPATGLQLTISEDGSYSEVKTDDGLELAWFGTDGVLVDSPTPSTGITRQVAGNTYIQPSPPRSGRMRSRVEDQDTLRYDDGDTLICDQLRLENDKLVRVISAATDEIYLNRIIAIYKKFP